VQPPLGSGTSPLGSVSLSAPTSPTGAAGVSLLGGTAAAGVASGATSAGACAGGFAAEASSVAGREPELPQPADRPRETRQLENDFHEGEDICAQLSRRGLRVGAGVARRNVLEWPGSELGRATCGVRPERGTEIRRNSCSADAVLSAARVHGVLAFGEREARWA